MREPIHVALDTIKQASDKLLEERNDARAIVNEIGHVLGRRVTDAGAETDWSYGNMRSVVFDAVEGLKVSNEWLRSRNDELEKGVDGLLSRAQLAETQAHEWEETAASVEIKARNLEVRLEWATKELEAMKQPKPAEAQRIPADVTEVVTGTGAVWHRAGPGGNKWRLEGSPGSFASEGYLFHIGILFVRPEPEPEPRTFEKDVPIPADVRVVRAVFSEAPTTEIWRREQSGWRCHGVFVPEDQFRVHRWVVTEVIEEEPRKPRTFTKETGIPDDVKKVRRESGYEWSRLAGDRWTLSEAVGGANFSSTALFGYGGTVVTEVCG